MTSPNPPMLVVFGGLPGTGKSTIARALVADFPAVYLRVDEIEQAIRSVTGLVVGPEGYVAAHALARSNLALGTSVIADSVNPLDVTRTGWREVARVATCPCFEVEIACSDPNLHRRRVEGRPSEVSGLRLPTWAEVSGRLYQPWPDAGLRIDTATTSVAEAVSRILDRLRCRLVSAP